MSTVENLLSQHIDWARGERWTLTMPFNDNNPIENRSNWPFFRRNHKFSCFQYLPISMRVRSNETIAFLRVVTRVISSVFLLYWNGHLNAIIVMALWAYDRCDDGACANNIEAHSNGDDRLGNVFMWCDAFCASFIGIFSCGTMRFLRRAEKIT